MNRRRSAPTIEPRGVRDRRQDHRDDRHRDGPRDPTTRRATRDIWRRPLAQTLRQRNDRPRRRHGPSGGSPLVRGARHRPAPLQDQAFPRLIGVAHPSICSASIPTPTRTFRSGGSIASSRTPLPPAATTCASWTTPGRTTSTRRAASFRSNSPRLPKSLFVASLGRERFGPRPFRLEGEGEAPGS